MPLDNLEEFFREKVAELDHTLPPEVTWSKIQGWQQLQTQVSPKRRRVPVWYAAVAVSFVALNAAFLLTLVVNRLIKITQINKIENQQPPVYSNNQAINQVALPDLPVAATIVPVPARLSEPSSLKESKHRLVKKKSSAQTFQKNIALTDSSAHSNSAAPVLAEMAPEPLPAEIVPEQKPIKITVVLGNKTDQNFAVASNDVPVKMSRKKNKRVKLEVTLPGEQLPEDSGLAATANQLPNRSALSAKIDL